MILPYANTRHWPNNIGIDWQQLFPSSTVYLETFTWRCEVLDLMCYFSILLSLLHPPRAQI